jgi:hypothetical protein
VKRTQLYLDEETARILKPLSHQKGTTISELVRTSLRWLRLTWIGRTIFSPGLTE